MRYLPHTDQDRADMLKRIGVADIDALFADVPADKLLKDLPDLPAHKSEMEVAKIMGAQAALNRSAGDGPFFIGAGAYRHHVPATVDHIIQYDTIIFLFVVFLNTFLFVCYTLVLNIFYYIWV